MLFHRPTAKLNATAKAEPERVIDLILEFARRLSALVVDFLTLAAGLCESTGRLKQLPELRGVDGLGNVRTAGRLIIITIQVGLGVRRIIFVFNHRLFAGCM